MCDSRLRNTGTKCTWVSVIINWYPIWFLKLFFIDHFYNLFCFSLSDAIHTRTRVSDGHNLLNTSEMRLSSLLTIAFPFVDVLLHLEVEVGTSQMGSCSQELQHILLLHLKDIQTSGHREHFPLSYELQGNWGHTYNSNGSLGSQHTTEYIYINTHTNTIACYKSVES